MLRRMAGTRGWVAIGCGLVLQLATASAPAAPLDAETAERIRIQRHLAQVERELRQAPSEQLAPAARLARARLLDELHQYWLAGVFPRNSGHPNERRPYFIDLEGRPCAVGALIQRSGHVELAARIDRDFHNDYVPDMTDRALLAWAKAHGFSVQELARIQPSYCACGTGWDAAGGAGGMAGEEAAAYDPVCGSDGLTYWNACIAELCGGAARVTPGECAHETPCELCGTGTQYVAVSECTNDAPEGICDLPAEPSVLPVSDQVAARWLELQQRDCRDPDYDLPIGDESQGWQPAAPLGSGSVERWDCANEAGGGGSPAGGSPGAAPEGGAAAQGGSSDVDEPESGAEPSAGCSCATVPSNGPVGGVLALLALLRLRRRARS